MIVQDAAPADVIRFQNPGVYVQGLDSLGNVVQVGGVPTPPATAASSPTRFVNAGANASLNVKASSGNVFSISCVNVNVVTRYIQLHNTATVPAGGDVPVCSWPVVATSGITLIGTDFFTNGGSNFSTGIAFAFSTTLATYTAGSAADQFTIVMFK